MKKNRKYFMLLSAYLDGELSGAEKAELEKLLQESEELRSKLSELQKIKQITRQIKPLAESPYLDSKIMARLSSGKEKQAGIRKWIPAFALLSVTVIIAFILKINPDIITNFWEEQKSTLAGFYKENLQPVLYAANLTNEDIFNFAFNNEIPLNNNRDQYLHLGYDDSGKEYFEIRPAVLSVNESDYHKFLTALNLGEKEKQIVDSVIGSYAEELESQILVNDKNTLAINAKLWNYRKAIFADLITVAQKLNRTEALKFIPQRISDEERIRVVNALQHLKTVRGNQYIFCTPDSVFSDSYEFKPVKMDWELKNPDKKLKVEIERVKQLSINLKFDSTWKQLDKNRKINQSFRIEVDSNICRVDIPEFYTQEIQMPDFDSINSFIEEATRKIQFYTYNIPKVEHFEEGVKIDYFEGDSILSFEFKYEDINTDPVIQSELDPEELVEFDEQKWFRWFNDSALSRYQFDIDYFSRYYDRETMKQQMLQLKEEMNKLQQELLQKNSIERKGRVIRVK